MGLLLTEEDRFHIITSMSPAEENANKILTPITDVFGGADGGVAFAKLRHGMLPQLLATEENDPAAAQLCEMVRQFSRLCEMVLR